jgi:acyl carrier protein
MAMTETNQIKSELIGILQDVTSDWEGFDGAFSEGTRLVADISFESVEIVQLMVAIEQHFQLKRMSTSRLLMEDGRYVEDISVGQIVAFISEELNKQ